MAEQAQQAGSYLVDGDQGFLGFNSKDNPQSLEKGTLSLCQNYRLNRGIAETRKGLQKLTPAGVDNVPLRFVTTFKTTAGVDLVVLIAQTGLYYFNTVTATRTGPIAYPAGQVILSTDEVGAYQAGGSLYILRGLSQVPFVWTNGGGSIALVPQSPSTHMPNAIQGIYVNNRGILQSSSDEISVSHYLEQTHFNLMDVFKINDGSNDSIVAIAPWVLNEFVVFMRNRMYYASVGAGAYVAGDAPVAADSYVKILATDIGCIARGSIAQAAGGMLFLSDGGVYMLTPQAATTPEGMRAGVMGEPLSSPIDDIIQRINQNSVSKAVGAYFNNRYYLAIPIDGSVTNNVVVIFNFINKQWESIDTFQSGMDVSFMTTGIFNGKRRLFFIDKDFGIFLTEELEDGDHYDNSTLNLVLPLELPFTLYDPLDANAFTRFHIDSKLITRSYNYGFSEDKRYSQVEVDLKADAGSQVKTTVLAENPYSETVIDNFGVPLSTYSTRDLPIRKVASSCLIKIESYNKPSSVRSLFVTAIRTGNNIRSTK